MTEYRQYQCRDCGVWTSHMETSLLETEQICSGCCMERRSIRSTERAMERYMSSWAAFHEYREALSDGH